jgi:hypothetical protein
MVDKLSDCCEIRSVSTAKDGDRMGYPVAVFGAQRAYVEIAEASPTYPYLADVGLCMPIPPIG